MITYQISLSDAENLALGHVALDQDEWIQNAASERCRVAMEDIIQLAVQKCLEFGLQIPGSKDEIVMLAFEQGWVISAAQKMQDIQSAQQINQGA